MRKILLLLLTLTSFNSCQINWYGDIDLGSDFYYMVDPAFNSIVIPVNPDEPYASSIYIIKEIESIGFNENYIIATSMDRNEIQYWRIDKKAESKELGYKDNSILQLSNVSKISESEFNRIRETENIEQKTKLEYRKQLNYE